MNILRTLAIPFLLTLCACGGSSAETSQEVGGSLEESQPSASLAAGVPEQAAQSPQSGVASRSRAVFSRTDLDLGTLFQQTEVPISFPFAVEGPDPITITGLDASCGCTGVELEVDGKPWPLKTPIPAGSQGAIKGTFTSAHYLNVKPSTVTVKGNALNLPMALNLKAFIRRHFEVSPSAARFGQLLIQNLRTEPVSQKIRVIGREPFEIRSWKRLPQGVQAKLLPEATMLEDGRQERHLEITLDGQLSAGSFMKSILAETTLDIDLEVQILANVVGPVRFAPEEFLKFGVVSQGTPTKRQVKILASDPSVTLSAPTVEFLGPDVFSYKLVEKQPGVEWVVRFELKADTPIGRHGGRLVIRFPNEDGLAEREIKVSALVRTAP